MRFTSLKSFKAQKGIALISAMLIVALATAITVSLSFDQSLIVRKSEHLQNRAQSHQYVYGLEDWVQTILNKDADDSKIDDLSEDWAIQIPPLPVDRGYLSGFIDDEQAKINLNSLISSSDMNVRFKLLCDQLDIDKEFIPALLDWIDADVDVRYPDGAEDDYYTSLEIPYRTANRLMSDVTELLLIKGIKDEDFDKLLPFITVLPEATPLNVNTLSKEVFLSLDKTLDDSHFDSYKKAREEEPFKSVNGMSKQLKINISEKDLSVTTDYFLVNGEVVQDESILYFHSLIQRKKKVSNVLYRRLGL